MKKKRQPTELAKTIAGGDTRGDSDAKRLFQINEIAAWFLKSCVEEFSQLTIQDIVSGWIAKADKRFGTEPVMQDVPPRISVIGSEDNSRTDGTVYFDFRTEIPLPDRRRTWSGSCGISSRRTTIPARTGSWPAWAGCTPREAK